MPCEAVCATKFSVRMGFQDTKQRGVRVVVSLDSIMVTSLDSTVAPSLSVSVT